ncbi:ABC transporter permease subunit [Sphingomonas canadensis]|uniref:ABC transporter permease subunit n=1 Tax=Sphingomonas canadensis TaxID=1219257 RepID=A0ABW3H7C1_9SPHN|nr:ABC transporter permease subunit [Sphingomonas canadensis]MCW3836949.1 ABC transporter permease subunit [Sphingomonas canadensis]
MADPGETLAGPAPGARLLRRVTGSLSARIGLGLLIAAVLAALLAPLLATHDPDAIDMAARLLPPDATHWAGTDEVGRDLYSRILWGARTSLGIGLGVVAIGALAGTLIGGFSGLMGGWIDAAIMRFMDLVMALPGLVLALALAAALGPSLTNAMIAMGVLGVPGYCRVARGQALALRQHGFVLAAHTFGAGPWHILVRHILPNLMAPMLVIATLDVGNAMIGVATLSFIGLGAQPPLAEWGAMVNAGQSYILSAWWYATLPGLAILLTALGFNLVGDAIGSLANPKGDRA